LPGLGERFDYDVERLLAGVSARWFDHWRRAYDFEPWGEERFDRAIGILVQTLVAVNRIDPRDVDDYMPYLKQCRPPAEPLSDAEVTDLVAGINQALSK
jgi:hypothetical protein